MDDTDYRNLEWQLRRLEMLRRVIGNQIVARAGLLRGRLPILEYVCGHEGTSQRALADMLHISPASITVTLRRMASDGLIERQEDAADQRVKRIYSTAEGRRKLATCRHQFDRVNRRMFAAFTPEELGTLSAMFVRLFESLAGSEHADFCFMPEMVVSQQQEEDMDD